MSVIAAPADVFFPAYLPSLDRAVSPTAGTLRAAILEIPANSWTQQTREHGESALSTAIENARRRGIPVGQNAYELASALVWALPSHVPLPDIVVEEDSEIAFDWHEASDRGITITVNDRGFLGYSSVVGLKTDYGRSPFAGIVPDTVVLNLLRVYPLRSPGRRLS